MWGNVRHRSPCRCITKAVLDAGPHQQLLALAEPIGSEVMAFLKVCSNLQQQARGGADVSRIVTRGAVQQTMSARLHL